MDSGSISFKAPNGDIKERPYFSIEFDDGER
jgi:hypothetical protein